MTLPLLHTKIHIPHLRPGYVARPRLVERLQSATVPGLILVSAPPGFGKTTLLAEWHEDANLKSKINNLKFAWLSLDAADNDPPRFLSYLVAALQVQSPGLGQAALGALAAQAAPQAGAGLGIEAVGGVLINEIAAFGQPLALVLDDYHLIQNELIHRVISLLLDYLPANLLVAIASRADPPFPLGRLRARGQMLELRAADLRFTPGEALAFLNQSMGLGLTAEQSAALDVRTEGWAAGLQLAAVSLQQRLSVHDAGGFDAFINQFSGENRYILDYLVEEVLASQPAQVQNFLLCTSILEQFSAVLCDALLATAAGSSQVILDLLERSNLFLLPLDERREWYRYHPLFADLLRARLQAGRGKSAQAELHRRAAAWFEHQGDLSKAIAHFLAAQAYPDASRCINQAAPLSLSRGELGALSEWLHALPDELLRGEAQLCMFMAWAQTLTAQIEAAEGYLNSVDGLIERGMALPVDRFVGQAAAVRAMIASMRYDIAGTIAWAEKALALLPQDDLARGVVGQILGGAYWQQGDVVAAEQALADAARLSLQAGNLYAGLMALHQQAQLRVIQGKLSAAEELCRRGLKIAGQAGAAESPVAGQLYCGMGEVNLEHNNLEQAFEQVGRGLELGRRTQDLNVLLNGSLCMARLELLRGNPDAAQQLLDQTEQVLQQIALPHLLAILAARRARLALVQEDIKAVAAWHKSCGLNPADVPNHLREEQYLTLAWALILLGESAMAEEILVRWLEHARAGQRGRSVIEILALQALAQRALGQKDAALQTLGEALALAQPEGFVRIFADQGRAMGEAILDFRMKILDLAQPANVPLLDYLQRLLEAFPGLSISHSPAADLQSKIKNQNSKIPLSQRELEVLRLLVEGLSSKEIAERLVISFSTARTHVKNIYRKLDAHNRVQLVEAERELSGRQVDELRSS